MSQVDPNPPADDRPHRPADDSEEVYFEGSPLLRAEAGKIFLWSLVALALIAGGVIAHMHDLPWWLSVVLIVLAIVAISIPVISTRTVQYRITNYRIDYGQGLLSRDTDTMELWHVEDLHLHQGLFDRMMDVGTIIVFSHDDTTPQLRLHGLPNPQAIFNTLKQRVIAVKRQRGVVKMDVGQ